MKEKITYLTLFLILSFQLTILSGNIFAQNVIKLSDLDWKFIGIEPQLESIKKPDLKDAGWLPIQVPGDVNASLLKNRKIPNPHYDTLARDVYWVTAKEWWYALSFNVGTRISEKSVLVLEGVDGNADIWLNDEHLGIMKDAFYPHRFDIKGKLKEKDNVLFIRFQSINELLGGKRPDELTGWKSRRGFLRKPQFSFGW